MNIKHKTIDASQREIKNLDDVLNRVTVETNAEFIPRNYILFYKEYVLAESSLEGVGRLKGYGGEIFKGFYNNVSRTIQNKISILNRKHSENVKSFVNDIYNSYSRMCDRNSSDLFYQRERSHFWTGSNTRASLSYCKVYNPLQGPKLLAAGYRIQGGIRNSSLHENMFETLPISIRNLPINYSIIEKIFRHFIIHKFKNVVDYNYFLRPEFLTKGINYDLIDSIISKSKIESMINSYSAKGIHDTLLHKIFAVSNFFRIISS